MLKEELIKIHVEKLDKKLYKAVQDKWDLVAKPLNGLGDFEKIFDRILLYQCALTMVWLRKASASPVRRSQR